MQRVLGNERDIRLYMFLRLTMLYSVLISTLGYQMSGVLNSAVVANSYIVIFSTFFVTSVFVFFYEKTKHIRYFLVSQVAYDILFTTALIFYTGAYDSIYTIFYFFNIIFAAILFKGKLEAVMAALVSGGLYASIFVLNVAQTGEERLFPLFTTVTAFISIALLSGQLIEELGRSRQRISRLEELSEEIVNSLDSGLLGLDRDDIIRKVNRTGQQLLGVKVPETILRHHLSEILPGLEYVQGSQIRELTIQGKIRRMLVTRVGLPEGHGMILFRDLTDILGLEEKLQRQERLAGVGRLATGVAHEIRNPIASISGAAQLLAAEEADAEEQRRLTQIIVRESERVDRLVGQLLKFAKPTVRQREEVDLNALIQECVEAMRIRPDFQKLNVSIEAKIDGKTNVKGNKDELREAVTNLLVNAMQALGDKPDGEPRTVKVEARNTGSRVEFSVSDNGPGVPREYRGRVFDPFFTTKPTGTGLGLAQVYKIVRDHDGQIDLETEEGQGTSFRIRLPV